MRRLKCESAQPGGVGRGGEVADERSVKTKFALLGVDPASSLACRADDLARAIPSILTAERRRATVLTFCRCWCGVLALRRGESFDFGGVL